MRAAGLFRGSVLVCLSLLNGCGTNGADGSCAVADNGDGTATITCADGSKTVVRGPAGAGAPGAPGTPGSPGTPGGAAGKNLERGEAAGRGLHAATLAASSQACTATVAARQYLYLYPA